MADVFFEDVDGRRNTRKSGSRKWFSVDLSQLGRHACIRYNDLDL